MSQITKKVGFVRMVNIVIAVALQLVILVVLVGYLEKNSVFVYLILEILALIVVFNMVQSNQNTSYTHVWTVVLLVFPALGILLHFFWSNGISSGPRSEYLKDVLETKRRWLNQDVEIMKSLERTDASHLKNARYLEEHGFPVYTNTALEYFPLGEDQFSKMIDDMKKAQKFIFVEYFIMDTGDLWDRVFSVLKERASAGVHIRILYDDVGSIMTLPDNFSKDVSEYGIVVKAFNPVNRYIARMHLNYRNHQKITVIDGNIGYTGGTNLADEYANIYEKYGHWKDTAIRLEGDAVWSLSVIFLKMWQTESGVEENFNEFMPSYGCTPSGFVQPFADGPHNNPKNPAESLYKMIIANAQKYVYITTPYLIIDNDMMELLIVASKSGIDVRIITPHIPDKWYVHAVTRSNYGRLIENGVRIYEYTPGYIHAKMIISDDDNGVIGSINMDYRSFNLHFENGVWICRSQIIEEIKADINGIIDESDEVTLQEWMNSSFFDKMKATVLRFFAPLM